MVYVGSDAEYTGICMPVHVCMHASKQSTDTMLLNMDAYTADAQ